MVYMELSGFLSRERSIPVKCSFTAAVLLFVLMVGKDHQGNSYPRSRLCGQERCVDFHYRLLHK